MASQIFRRTCSLAYVHSKLIQGHGKQGGMEKIQKTMPPNRCLIDSNWVFKKKIDGLFRACLVAWG